MLYRDLYNKNKARGAFISKDYQELCLWYDFRSKPIAGKFNPKSDINKEQDCFNGKLKIKFENKKKFRLELKLPNSDLDLLYKIVLSMTYILGKNLHLQYFDKKFPYYTVDEFFNLNARSSPISKRVFEDFLNNPKKYLKN